MNKDLWIEFIGLPGSGKTTIAKKLGKEIHISQKYEIISGGLSSQHINNYLKFFLHFHRLLGKPLRLYDTWAYEVIKKDPSIQQNLEIVFKTYHDFSSTEAQDFLQLPLIAKSLERDLIFNSVCKKEKKNYINDDGIFQRLLSIFGLRHNNWNHEKAKAFESSVTKLLNKNFVILVNCSTDLALSRLLSRKAGPPQLLQKNNLAKRLTRTQEYLNYLKDNLKKSDIKTISIESEVDLDLTVKKIVSELSDF